MEELVADCSSAGVWQLKMSQNANGFQSVGKHIQIFLTT